MIECINNISKHDFTAYLRFQMIRNKANHYVIAICMIFASLSVIAIFSDMPKVFLAVMVGSVSLGMLLAILIAYFKINAIGITTFPQIYTFTDKDILVANADGSKICMPWLLVNKIVVGRRYYNLLTKYGVYIIKKDNLDNATYVKIRKLWENDKNTRLQGQNSDGSSAKQKFD